MSLPKYQSPPYPVYKSYFVPYFDPQNGDVLDVREVTRSDVEECWRKMLEEMRQFLQYSLSGTAGVRRLELTGDMIVLFLKAPLLREPLEQLLPSPLKLLICMRILNAVEPRLELEELDPIAFCSRAYRVYEMWERMKDRENMSRALEILTKAQDFVEKCWFIFPADSRPLLNSSGLIPHSLVTSALAWIFAFSEKISREECAIIRLASLLHDFGKPFDIFNHVLASRKVAEFLLSEIIDDDSLRQVLELIEHHHDERHQLGRIIVRADRLASASDRLGNLLKKRLEKILGYQLSDEEIYRWEFWRNLHMRDGQLIRLLSEKLVREMRENTEWFTSLKKVLEEARDLVCEPVNEAVVVCIDSGGIQDFISKRQELRSLGAASFTVDCLVMVQIPSLLQARFEKENETWLPLETILYSSGGNVTLLLPSQSQGMVEKLKDELNKYLLGVDPSLRLRLVSVQFRPLYFLLSEDLGRELGLSKIRIEKKEMPVIIMDKPCKTCQMLPRVDGKDECTTCRALYDLGTEFHFKRRWEGSFKVGDLEIIPSKCFGKEWGKVGDNIMAIIAGHDFEELESGMEKRDYAVLSADGNIMGTFMGTSITLTDMYERSARIDLALKRAFEESALELRKALKEIGGNAVCKTLAVLKLGLLYIGGDDTLLLLPSWLAPIISCSLAEKFLKYMGGARGISIGIAAGPYTSPVWSLIDAARKLQSKAKEGKKVREEMKGAKSSVCLDISDVVLSKTSVEQRREVMEKERSSDQPFLIGENENSLRSLIELIMEKEGENIYVAAYGVSHPQLLEKASDNLKKEIEKIPKDLKKIRQILREAVTASRNLISSQDAGLVNKLCMVYLMKEMNRSKEEEKPIYLKLLRFFTSKGNSTYGDVDLLIKILGGGVI